MTASGLACCLIRTSVFPKLGEPPWFVDEHARSPVGAAAEGRQLTSEDRYFWRLMNENGCHGLAHGGLLCGHIDSEGRVYQLGIESYPFREIRDKEVRPLWNGNAA